MQLSSEPQRQIQKHPMFLSLHQMFGVGCCAHLSGYTIHSIYLVLRLIQNPKLHCKAATHLMCYILGTPPPTYSFKITQQPLKNFSPMWKPNAPPAHIPVAQPKDKYSLLVDQLSAGKVTDKPLFHSPPLKLNTWLWAIATSTAYSCSEWSFISPNPAFAHPESYYHHAVYSLTTTA